MDDPAEPADSEQRAGTQAGGRPGKRLNLHKASLSHQNRQNLGGTLSHFTILNARGTRTRLGNDGDIMRTDEVTLAVEVVHL